MNNDQRQHSDDSLSDTIAENIERSTNALVDAANAIERMADRDVSSEIEMLRERVTATQIAIARLSSPLWAIAIALIVIAYLIWKRFA